MGGKFLVLSVNDPDAEVREYKRRKFHTKDRRGCAECRQKRVKVTPPSPRSYIPADIPRRQCDQTKPACARCNRAGRLCHYKHSAPDSYPTPQSLPPWDSTLVRSILGKVVVNKWLRKGTSAEVLMRHATDTMSPILGTFLDNTRWELVCSHPFLLASILAVSASHLAYYTADTTKHRVAECALLSACLETFRPALCEPLNAQRSDAFLLTSMLLNNLAFSRMESLDPFKSWVFEDREDRLGWLSLQMGMKPLLMATAPFRNQSLLRPIYKASDDDAGTFSKKSMTLVRIPAHWMELATEMDERVNAVGGKGAFDEEKPFREAVRLLAEIRLLAPSLENTFLYVQFFKALDVRFVRLLYNRDEGALWMFGYWLGLMARLDTWWCKRRAVRDWAAIREFFWAREAALGGGGWGEMRRLLVTDLDSVRPVEIT